VTALPPDIRGQRPSPAPIQPPAPAPGGLLRDRSGASTPPAGGHRQG
jgi:hypothetical protein